MLTSWTTSSRCIPIALLVVTASLLATPGCVTVDMQGGQEMIALDDPKGTGPLLQKQIEKRIDNLKYQRGDALLDSLNWLILYGEYAVPQLEAALIKPDHRTRSYAAYVLGEIGDTAVVPKLRESLGKEKNKLVRYEMASSLMTLGDWGQIGVLIDGLGEDSRLFRFKCFEVLKKNLNLTFGFDPAGAVKERTAAVRKWRAWWERNKDKYTPIAS